MLEIFSRDGDYVFEKSQIPSQQKFMFAVHRDHLIKCKNREDAEALIKLIDAVQDEYDRAISVAIRERDAKMKDIMANR